MKNILRKKCFNSIELFQFEIAHKAHIDIEDRVINIIDEKDKTEYENGFTYVVKIRYKGKNYYFRNFHPYVYHKPTEYERVDGRKYRHLFKTL